MYYTVIRHSGHLRTLEKCRKHSPAARVFYISLVFSNVRRVLSQCNIRLRLLYLLIIIWIGSCARSDWSKIHVLSGYKVYKKCVLLFFATLLLVNIFVRDGDKQGKEEIYDGAPREAAESFEHEACST